MRDQNSEYISKLKLEDFKILLQEFDIELDEETQETVLSIIKNNQYALVHDQYQFVLENYIKKYLNMIKIKLFVVLENETAVRFWEKRGFCKTGVLYQERYINAEWKDVVIMEKYLKEKLR